MPPVIRHAFAILAALLCAGCSWSHPATSTKGFPKTTGFVKQDLVVDGVHRHVWIFVPADYDPNKKTPAILFLHGLFEGGSGEQTVLTGGLGPVIAQRAATWPFITIFPQSAGKWQTNETDNLAMAALTDAQRRYNIDPERIILAGLSYGGLGVWEIGARHHDLFAAMVPVSGLAAMNTASMLTDVPIWAFANTYDGIIDPQFSRDMVKAIRDHGGNAKITEFDNGADHDCWPEVVEQSEVVDWMLLQHRSGLYRQQAPTTATSQPGGKLKSLF